MTVLLNNQPVLLPYDNMTVEEFANWKSIPFAGTAIAINDKLVKKDQWSVLFLKDMDQITVITAAFGG